MIVFFVLSGSAIEVFLSARTPSVARLARSIPCAVAQHRNSSIRSIPSKSSSHHDLRAPARNGDSPTSLVSSTYELLPSQRGYSTPFQPMFQFVISPFLYSPCAAQGKHCFSQVGAFPGVEARSRGSDPRSGVGAKGQGVGASAPTSESRDQWASAPEETLLVPHGLGKRVSCIWSAAKTRLPRRVPWSP
jgi:hypothetical protein